uniref:Uncharacterized protein n=1 Tax=Lactuca sativa TaxID=4236 RepID=A0A9R1UDL6_LACSA|nr:hypothetical protein LSAT_V11C900500160 [Lactuca sativa]
MLKLLLLKNICEGPMQGLLIGLKTFILCNCLMLTSLCAYGAIMQIRHLDIFVCIWCNYANSSSGSQRVLSDERDILWAFECWASSILPNLNKLIRSDIPQLTIKKLSFKKDSVVKLNLVELEKSWWEILEND